MPPPPPPIRVLLLGAHGLLGSAFHRLLASDPEFTLVEFGRAELNLANLANLAQLEPTLDGLDFNVLINCAAYTAVDDCEIHGELPRLVNSEAPGILAGLCTQRSARMLQFSTDYVFDGARDTPYTEADAPNPLSIYGRSKLDGEEQVLAASSSHLVARLSWLFGMGRAAFPEWVIKRASTQPRVEIVSDKSACPTWDRDVVRLLKPWIAGQRTAGGILHLCNPPACTWIEYGQHALDCAAEAGFPLLTQTAEPISITALPGLTAARPPYSAMASTRLGEFTNETPQPWRDALREHVFERRALQP